MQTLKVRAVPGAAVLDVAFSKAHGRLRFVGRKLVRVTEAELRAAAAAGSDRFVGISGEHALPEAVKHCDVVRERDVIEPGDVFYVEAWMPLPDPVEVPAMGDSGAYFRKRVREGGLAAADEATAKLCGVPWSATAPKAKKGGE